MFHKKVSILLAVFALFFVSSACRVKTGPDLPIIDQLTCFQNGEVVLDQTSTSGFSTSPNDYYWHWKDANGTNQGFPYRVSTSLWESENIPCMGHISDVNRSDTKRPTIFTCIQHGKQILSTQTDNGASIEVITVRSASVRGYVWTNADGKWFINISDQITCY